MPAREGWQFWHIGGFLGDFFIYKCVWSTPESIRQNCASFKKFYAFMADKGEIGKADLADLKNTIREDIDTWIEDCKRVNG